MTATKPFRFGIVAGFAPSLAAWTAQARRIEELGLDTMYATDPVGGLDPLTLVPAALAVTEKLTVGTFVLADPFRDARHLAWQADSLHQSTGGRFLLGLGVGHGGAGKHAATLGREFASPGARIARLADTIEELASRPDRPPLVLAGTKPKMLELAARTADVVTFAWGPRTTEAEADSIVDTFRSFAGHREVALAVNLTAIGDKSSPQLARYTGVDVPQLVAEKAVTVLPENPAEAGETLHRWQRRWGISQVTVNSGYAEQLAAIAAGMRGRPAAAQPAHG
jgi:alkanesulfonate monooxygenase SsuD/methylene tetrahydromethanopterin reductase-like flavin-dependent oxidoreductase (luciferase family)